MNRNNLTAGWHEVGKKLSLILRKLQMVLPKSTLQFFANF